MKRIVFYDFCDLADCMIDKAKNEVDVSAICHFEYASSLLHELIKKNCMVSSIDISDYSFDGYDREYLISLNREHEIIVKPLYSYKKDGYKRDGYLYHEGEFVYIHQDCCSEILNYVTGDHLYEFSVAELDKDEENTSECCSELNESHHISYDKNGKLTGFQKAWTENSDGVPSYFSVSFSSEDESKIINFAKDLGVELK